MGRETITPLPALLRHLQHVGENLRLARLRRHLQAAQVAERAGLSRTTLRAIERGDPAVSFGAYASVLFCLGLENDLAALGGDDELGRRLQDAQIPVGSRAPRREAQSKSNPQNKTSPKKTAP